MTWSRVAGGSIHLHALYGTPGSGTGSTGAPASALSTGSEIVAAAPPEASPAGPFAALAPRLARSLVSQPASPAGMWDVAAAAIMAGWRRMAQPVLPASLVEAEAAAAAAEVGGV